MTTAGAQLLRRSPGAQRLGGLVSALRSVAAFVVVVILLAVAWEAAKWIAGDPWREVLGRPIDPPHIPPFDIKQLNDLNLPHVWDVIGAFSRPSVRNSPFSLGAVLIDAAIFTGRSAVLGFLLGAVVGLGLAILFVRSRVLERALVPYVIATQTVPIVALAPMLVLWVGREWTSVVLVSAYLTFFPVTIAGIRGLSSPDPRALELMRSYAASEWSVLWKVRMQAALPYLFTAFKISATASVVGAIVGEEPTGIRGGLGRAILQFNTQYSSGPEKLWAVVMVAAALGIAFFVVVRVVELVVLRNRVMPSDL
ncbi:MAG: ABC transporter permease subunit [Chloroflexota bacterium]|nr:ABC transporter permease subunit [Chloroflexota bacterium]